MRSRFLFRDLGIVVALAASAPSAALAGHLARNPRPGGSPARAAAPQGTVCGPTTVTESSSQTIVDQGSIACVDMNTSAHADNSYWRAFDLKELGVLGPFDVCAVSF